MSATEPDLLATSAAGGAAVRGGALRVAGYGLTAIMGAGSAAVLFRHLGVSNTGLYVTAMSIVAIVGGLSDLGVSTLGVRELAIRDPDARSELMRTLLGLRIVITLIGVGIGVAFAAIAGYRSPLVVGVAVAGAGLLVQNMQNTLALMLVRDLRLGWVTAFEVLRQGALALLVIALALSGAGLIPILAAAIPASLLAFAGTVAVVRGTVPLRPSFAGAEWRSLMRQLLPYTIAIATAVLYFRVSVVAVSLISSGRDLGYFSASFRIIEVLITIPALMVGAAFPIFARAARDDHARFAYGVERMFEVAAIVGVGFALLLALGAPVAVDIVGGAKFDPTIPILRIQAVGLGGSFVGAVWSYALLSLGMQRELITISLVALSAGTILVVSLTFAFGIDGAAVATAATEVGLAVVGLALLARRGRQLVPSLRRLPRTLLAAGIAVGVALAPDLPSLPTVVIAAVVYLLGLVALRAIPREVADELSHWLPRHGSDAR